MWLLGRESANLSSRLLQRPVDGTVFFIFVELSRSRPSGDRCLFGTRQRELAARGIPGDGRSCADGRTGADSNRGHQHAARTDEGAVLDEGRPFVLPVVVAGNAAGPYVDAAAHAGIAHIAQVIGLAAGADFAALDLNEVADVHIVMQD